MWKVVWDPIIQAVQEPLPASVPLGTRHDDCWSFCATPSYQGASPGRLLGFVACVGGGRLGVMSPSAFFLGAVCILWTPASKMLGW